MTELNLPVGPNIVYKIRRRTDGLFSMGGSTPSFNKKGKIWKQRGHLTSHINQLWNSGLSYSSSNNTGHVYKDCEIVPYEIVETPVEGTQTIMGYIADRKAEKHDQAIKAKLKYELNQKELRHEQYNKLKQEFE